MVRSGITAFNGKVIGKALFIQNPQSIQIVKEVKQNQNHFKKYPRQ